MIRESLSAGASLPDALRSKIEGKGYSVPAFYAKMAEAGYRDAVSTFNDDITAVSPDEICSRLSKISTICIRKQKEIKNQLESICAEIVRPLSESLGVSVDMHIVDEIGPDVSFHVQPTDGTYEYGEYADIASEDKEVRKRRILDMLVIGAASQSFKELFTENIGKVFAIDEELPHLYAKAMALNNYLLFAEDIRIDDRNHYQAGYTEVAINGDGKDSVESYATLFPILLFETIRGIYEYTISGGLPDDNEMVGRVIDKADILVEEPWDMRIGPSLYNYLTGGEMTSPSESVGVLSCMAGLTADEMESVMNEICYSTKKGKKIRHDIVCKARHDSGYGNFMKDMDRKRGEKKLIADDEYFTEDELTD